MDFALTFFEGIITFISPCLLPMLPIYLLYFTGGEKSKARTVRNVLAFIGGFTLIFVSLGIFAASIGMFFVKYQRAVNITAGIVVILFGLNYAGFLNIGFLNRTLKASAKTSELGVFSSFVFGIVFTLGWTPCVGPLLGSALMLASGQASVLRGAALLLSYSIGLGIPFFLSAFLLDELKGAFDFIKKHYSTINRISGIILILLGILMATGLMGRLTASLNLSV